MKKISVSYIVKNEQDNIIRSLESVKDFGEIVIVDTGSTDNTKQIIQEWIVKNKVNASLYDYEWTNFADCRNYSLSKCTGEWILVLDADETLESPLDKLLEQDIDIWECIQLDKDGQMCQTYRFFKNGVKYRTTDEQDIIHETLDTDGYKIGKSDVIIKHWKNLTPQEHKSKIENIMNTFATMSDGAKKDYYEGIYYLHTGSQQKGIDALNRCISKVSPQLKAFIYLMIGTYYDSLKEVYEEIGAGFLNKCIEIAPEQNEGYIKLSEYYLSRGNIYKAIECLTKVQNRKNKLITDLQNDKFYTNEEIQLRINQLKELTNGIISN